MITINKKKCNSDKDCNDNMLCAFNDEDLNSYCIDNDLTHMYAGCLNNNKNDFETTISKVTDNIDYTNCIDFARRQESLLREAGERTSTRIQWFSILSIAVLLVTSIWQIIYLRRFFTSKKLL